MSAAAASLASPLVERREPWEDELEEVRAMTEREMENLVAEDDTPADNYSFGKTAASVNGSAL